MGKLSTTRKSCFNKHIVASMTLSAALVLGRPLHSPKAFAATNLYDWTKLEDIDRLGGYYSDTARSANGSHLLLSVAQGGQGTGVESPLYVSSDYGVSWQNVAGLADEGVRNNWESVDVSNDGQIMVASSNDGYNIDTDSDATAKLVKSEDGGTTWENITPDGSDDWRKVVVSGDGNTIAAIRSNSGEVFISENGGSSWAGSSFGVNSWNTKTMAISDDGNKILVGGENGNEYLTTLHITENKGADWTDISPDSQDEIYDIQPSISSDGNTIVATTEGYAGSHNDSVFISQNDGADWTEITPDSDDASWKPAISDDASTITVLDDQNDKMYVSKDEGDNWTEEAPAQDYGDTVQWSAIDVNEDGTRIIVTAEDTAYISDINISDTDPSTVTFDEAEGGKTVTLTTPAGTTITCHSAFKESSLATKDFAYSYPLGLVDFCFSGAEPSNEVSLVFVTDLLPNQVVARKHNPIAGTYATINASITETTYTGKHALLVTYTLVDNGPLDTDPDVGEIADPVGLGVADVAVPNTGFRRLN